METLTVQNGENFVFPKVSIMVNGELKFEIEKEEPIVETPSKPKKIVLNIKHIANIHYVLSVGRKLNLNKLINVNMKKLFFLVRYVVKIFIT